MINKKILTLTALLVLSFTVFSQVTPQDNTSLQSRITDLLTKMPAADQVALNSQMNVLAGFGEAGLLELAGMLLPPGKGNDATVRYAISGFSNYVTGAGQEKNHLLCQAAWCKALEKEPDSDNKSFLIAQLQLVGSDEAVPFISKYLLTDQLSDPAARALTAINTPAAGRILFKALNRARGASQISVVEALGNIKYSAAVKKITRMINSPDPRLKKVILYALAQLGMPESGSVMYAEAMKSGFVYEPTRAASSYLLWQERLTENGHGELAETNCIRLIEQCRADNQVQIRTEALSLLVRSAGEKAVPFLYDAAMGSMPQYRITAMSLAQQIKGEKQTLGWVEKAGALTGQSKADVITMLGERGDPTALTYIRQSLTDRDKVVKLAAIDAAVKLGHETVLPDLLTSMRNGSSDEVTAIRKQLLLLKGDALLPAITQAIPEMPSVARVALLEVLASRCKFDDQKLLLLRKAMEIASGVDEKSRILEQIGQCTTYPALKFAAGCLDDPDLQKNAAMAAGTIALSDSTITGDEVKDLLTKVLNILKDNKDWNLQDALRNRLTTTSPGTGYVPMFNGKDLTGWQGLVENPVIRAKMKPAILAKAQVTADEIMRSGWKVENGILIFTGTGENLCTTRSYGNFEMYVDWKIMENGDAGIYLRGSPQVQIWDPSRRDAGADVGSGGLYNNEINERIPLKVADNPVGEWNTFRIIMIGERVTVYLNGILVVDNTVMENYWDRSIPIFPDGPIELQAHGTWVGYRDPYVREIPRSGHD